MKREVVITQIEIEEIFNYLEAKWNKKKIFK